MRTTKSLIAAAAMLATMSCLARAEINVVASIKPVHSLVAGVMKGVAEPKLIIDGAGSPHTYALKPSQAATLEAADVVFWIGHELETFLEKPLESLASKAVAVELIDAEGLVKHDKRRGGEFESHKHGHGDDDHHAGKSEHAHGAHGGKAHGKKDAGHHHDAKKEADHHHDDHDAFDPHVWLDPVNAKAFVGAIEKALVKADPNNAATYQRNAKTMSALLDALVVEIATQTEPARGKGFIVFHDAYQYFEKRFGLKASGSITVSPEVMPGAKRITELRSKVQELAVACVFSEPQFEPKLVATVTEGTSARSAILDPLGAGLDNGPDLYFALVRNMAASVTGCLANAS